MNKFIEIVMTVFLGEPHSHHLPGVQIEHHTYSEYDKL